jgi:hypothetical protein
LFTAEWAQGCAPFWARSPRKGLGGARGFGFEPVPGGVPTGITHHRGAPEGAPPAEGGKSHQKAGTAVPLRCYAYCGALANHRAQVGCVTGCTAPPWSLRRCRVGGFARPFGDSTTGAHQLALVLSGALPSCGAHSPLSPICDSQSTDRWQEPVHQAPHVTAAWGDLGAKLWALAVNHHRLRKSLTSAHDCTYPPVTYLRAVQVPLSSSTSSRKVRPVAVLALPGAPGVV